MDKPSKPMTPDEAIADMVHLLRAMDAAIDRSPFSPDDGSAGFLSHRDIRRRARNKRKAAARKSRKR